MKKTITLLLLIFCVWACTTAVRSKQSASQVAIPAGSFEDTLRFLYSLPPDQWPAPFVDAGVAWQELGVLPESPLKKHEDSLQHLIALGKALFFDPRLSGGNKIACASCHMPALHWTDGRQRSLGHEMQTSKRNSPTILNTWFYKELFWDGRSRSLEDQAFSPINSETEMHATMPDLLRKLRKLEGYKPMFVAAYGNDEISPETVTGAIAVFERTLSSKPATFDSFLRGEKQALSNEALRGLHLFRTRARCINCHNGPLLSDNNFHNTGLTYYGQQLEDLGRYNFTHKEEDVGKFRTPSLRDVMATGPWTHNGSVDGVQTLLEMYNNGMPQQKPVESSDPLYPKTDPLIKRLGLTKQDIRDLVAFLHSITSAPPDFTMPQLPK